MEEVMYLKMSTRSIYGLRALIDLGLHAETETVSLQSIASRQNISINYLEQIMPLLKKAGLITSSRGAQGGYRLGRPADEISVGDVLRVLEGDLRAVRCQCGSCDSICTDGSEQGAEQGSCFSADQCVARHVWKQINDSITSAVDTLMLSSLLKEGRAECGTEQNDHQG